ncbi:chaperone protein dnaJ C76, chloroplastic [Rutidosis leptorrhynchoides]|uniref:chaperone protein dnaJ C76, chloroplastic n=1 Tax=Rutidosis leptorrhynchoides TaxID=125765 RepID=UPI003A999EA9
MAQMGCLQLCRTVVSFSSLYHHNCLNRPFESLFQMRLHKTQTIKYPYHHLSSNFKNNFKVRNSINGDQTSMSTSSAYQVLDLKPDCTFSDLKASFRAKVKEFHPDVRKHDDDTSDIMIRRIIQAYEVLSNLSKSEIIESECLDPFDAPECEAFDIFVNEVVCVGKGCPYSCVKRAPHAFSFSSSTGTAYATSQGHGEDYQVQLAVGQCPKSCIHYVTPSQRIILEELLSSILNMPFDCSVEAELLYSLIVKAKFENNRYSKPKKQPKESTKHVDLY